MKQQKVRVGKWLRQFSDWEHFSDPKIEIKKYWDPHSEEIYLGISSQYAEQIVVMPDKSRQMQAAGILDQYYQVIRCCKCGCVGFELDGALHCQLCGLCCTSTDDNLTKALIRLLLDGWIFLHESDSLLVAAVHEESGNYLPLSVYCAPGSTLDRLLVRSDRHVDPEKFPKLSPRAFEDDCHYRIAKDE